MKKKANRYISVDILEDINELIEEVDVYTNKRFINVTFDSELPYYSFTDCEFINCVFFDKYKSVVFQNCLFSGCEFSNSTFDNLGMQRSKIIDSHLVGVSINDSNIYTTDFIDNQMKYSNYSSVKFDDIIFNNDNLEQSMFNECSFVDLDITKSVFKECEFLSTSLKDIDMSDANIDSIMVDQKSIRGVIVNSMQAVELISLLGIVVK